MLSLKPEKKKAVAYYRHSAEDKQENSVAIQRGHAKKFAEEYGIEIIHEEADEGKSGLTADRLGFDRLFSEWILNPDAPDFDYILVYDVSRWGRFQDLDEPGYYEVLAKKRGKRVIYITHGFPTDENKLIRSLQTPIERYMAAEFSRQQSDKVWHGSAKVSEQGFSAGGTAPYGMNRILLDESKKPIGVLKRGEHKVIANQRVTFAPAGDDTTETIKRIFSLLVDQWYRPEEIAEVLNKEGSRSANGGLWSREKILRILSNEAYVGTRVYNKTWGRLKEKKRSNPRDEWVICVDAFEPTVDNKVFRQAQESLYWLLPYKWRRGVYTTNKVHRLIKQHLDALLESEESFEYDARWHIVRHFPLICGVTFFKDSASQWCFLIPESMKKYDHIIAVGVDIYRHDPIDKFFILPTEAFGLGNYLTFSETDDSYSQYRVDPEQVEEKVKDLSQRVART